MARDHVMKRVLFDSWKASRKHRSMKLPQAFWEGFGGALQGQLQLSTCRCYRSLCRMDPAPPALSCQT
eukprot:11608078-Karenia_brevis.AAC.1